ncbi:MAG: hypothetical protein JJV93_01165 [Alphaproteobacteria bacterium]|nr:hypothetical protein [Alphaproteobacteria bacterium]
MRIINSILITLFLIQLSALFVFQTYARKLQYNVAVNQKKISNLDNRYKTLLLTLEQKCQPEILENINQEFDLKFVPITFSDALYIDDLPDKKVDE